MTSPDVKANCDDLKVLGKGDFKALLKWRLALREEASYLRKSSIFIADCSLILAGPGCQEQRYRRRNGDRGHHRRH